MSSGKGHEEPEGPEGRKGAEPAPGTDAEGIDPDVDLHVPGQRAETRGGRAPAVLAAVAAGGALGSAARHGLALPWSAPPGGFPGRSSPSTWSAVR